MSGIIAWLTGFLDGNTGKYMCRATMYRPYMCQAGMCAGLGEGSGYVGDGVDFTLADDRPHFAMEGRRLHFAMPDDRPHFEVSE